MKTETYFFIVAIMTACLLFNRECHQIMYKGNFGRFNVWCNGEGMLGQVYYSDRNASPFYISKHFSDQDILREE